MTATNLFSHLRKFERQAALKEGLLHERETYSSRASTGAHRRVAHGRCQIRDLWHNSHGAHAPCGLFVRRVFTSA